jgi:hypothetical protein
MKLLIDKRVSRGSRNSDGIRIGKASISIKGTAFERIVKDNTLVYSNVGINDEGNLCLYVSFREHNLLYKMYLPKGSANEARISLNTKQHAKVLSPYMGGYEIKFISINDVDGVTEVILKKV